MHKFLKCDVHKSYYFFQSSVTRLQTRLDCDPITISLVGILLPLGTEQFSFLSCLHKVEKLLKKMSTVLCPYFIDIAAKTYFETNLIFFRFTKVRRSKYCKYRDFCVGFENEPFFINPFVAGILPLWYHFTPGNSQEPTSFSLKRKKNLSCEHPPPLRSPPPPPSSPLTRHHEQAEKKCWKAFF